MSRTQHSIETVAAIVGDERLGATAVIERLKVALGVTADTKLAEALRTNKQNISKWRARNSVPYAEAVFVSFLKGVSLDFLLTGVGGHRKPSPLSPSWDTEMVRAALANLCGFGLLSVPENRVFEATLDAAAQSIVSQCDRATQVANKLVMEKGLKPEDARSAAITATELLGSDALLFRAHPSKSAKRPKSKMGSLG